jgi:two-component system, response regulator RegA
LNSLETPAVAASPAVLAMPDRSLLIVEDDKAFLERLARAMEARGFVVRTSDTVADGLAQIQRSAPAFAVIDLRLGPLRLQCGD